MAQLVNTISTLNYNLNSPQCITTDGIHVWVTNYNGASVTQFDASNGLNPVFLSSGYGFNGPRGIATDGSFVWVANFPGNSVTQINATTGAYVANFSSNFANPLNIATNGSFVWVTNWGGNSVTQFNATDGSNPIVLSDPVYQFSNPRGIATDGFFVWVTNWGNDSVTRFNASDGSNPLVLPSGFSGPYSIATDGSLVWVVNTYSNSVTQFNASDGSNPIVFIDLIYGFNAPYRIIKNGSFVWVTNYSGASVTQFNAIDGSNPIVFYDPIYGFIHPDGITTDGSHVWVANYYGYTVTQFNASDGSNPTIIGKQFFNNPVATSSDGTSVWVVSTDGGSDYNGFLARFPIDSINTPVIYDNGTDPNYQFFYPWCVASDGSSVWVGNYYGRTITQVNALTGAFIRNIPLPGSNPFSISLDISSVWVGDFTQSTIWKLNRLQGTVDASFSYEFTGISGVASDGSSVWVTNYYNNSVTQMSATDGAFINNWNNGNGNYGFQGPYAVASDGSFVYVGNYDGVSVTKFNAITGAYVTSYSFLSIMYCGVATDGTRTFAFAYNGVYEIYQNNSTNLLSGLTTRYSPNNVSTDGTYTWVTNHGSNLMYQFQTLPGPDQATTNPATPIVNQPFSVSLYTPTINVIPGFRTMFVEPHQYELREGNTVVSTDYTYDSATHIITFYNVVLTNTGTHTLAWVDVTAQQTLYTFVISIPKPPNPNPNPICFGKGTDILCVDPISRNPFYKKIEHLKEGDYVKTYKRGTRKVQEIVKGTMKNNPNVWHHCMYKMKKRPGMTGDLMVTGGHSILVDAAQIPDSVVRKQKSLLGSINIEDKYMWLASECPLFQKIQDNEIYTYYHIALEHDNDPYRKYGIWANGVLTETASEKQIRNDPLIPLGGKKPTIQMQMGIRRPPPR